MRIVAELDRLIRDSVAYAEAYYPDLSDYVTEHAQEMQESVMRQHIDLYVNQFSLSLGEEGRKAVEVLLEVFKSMKYEELKYESISILSICNPILTCLSVLSPTPPYTP